MNQTKLDKGNDLARKIERLKNLLTDLQRDKIVFFIDLNRNAENSLSASGRVDYNQFLPNEKTVKDVYLKNVQKELLNSEAEFAAL